MTVRSAFGDRQEAGEKLGERLAHLTGRPLLVLGLPRGGVVVAAAIAARLQAPLDVVVVRKIGTPYQPELAMGALAMWGPHLAVVRNDHVIASANVSSAQFEAVRAREELEARRRAEQWERPLPDVSGTTAVLVDDGLATGATMYAAVEVARRAGAARVVAAVPVAARTELAELALRVDEVACLHAPAHFYAVGLHYRDFSQVEDATVTRLLDEARERAAGD